MKSCSGADKRYTSINYDKPNNSSSINSDKTQYPNNSSSNISPISALSATFPDVNLERNTNHGWFKRQLEN